MKTITLTEASNLLETATINQTIDSGTFITHKLTTPEGKSYLMVNGMDGTTIITQM